MLAKTQAYQYQFRKDQKMKKTSAVLLLSILAIGLTACGGGGGKSSSSGGSNSSAVANIPVNELDPKNIPPSRQDDWDAYVKKIEAAQLNQISGIYNVTTVDSSGKKDISYIYIESQSTASNNLTISAFDFMSDDISSEGSCYRFASGNALNAKINGEPGMLGRGSNLKRIEPWDNAQRISTYYIEIDGEKLAWELDISSNVLSVSYGQLKHPKHLVLESNGTSLSVTANKEILGPVSIQLIRANMCSGESVGEGSIGSTLYSGLYDATIYEGAKKYESYLYIDEKGKLSAYKYMGDGFDSSSNQNCYSVSSIYNRDLHGKGLIYDKENNRLKTNVDEIDLYWNLSESGAVVSVQASGGVAGDTYQNQARSISLSSKKASSITITDLQNSICK